MKYYVIVLYNGVINSLFENHYLPLVMQKLNHDLHLQIIIISYESNISQATACAQTYAHTRIAFHALPRTISLWIAAWRFARLLPQIDSYELIADSTSAAWISLKTHDPLLCTKITVYTHGLKIDTPESAISESYRMNALWHQFHAYRSRSFERSVLGNPALLIEVENRATQIYLNTQYGTRIERIRIAQRTH